MYFVNPVDWISSYRPQRKPVRNEQVLYVISTDGTVLYARPGKSAPQIRQLPKGSIVFVSGQTTTINGEIWRKAFVSGTQESGWIFQPAVIATLVDEPRLAVVKHDVKILEAPAIGSKSYGLLKKHDKILLVGDQVKDGHLTWSRVKFGEKTGWCLVENDGTVFVAQEKVRPDWKLGFHVYPGSKEPRTVYNRLLQLARAGKLAGLVIVENASLANQFAEEGVPYVVHRSFINDFTPTWVTDELAAMALWKESIRGQHLGLNKNVIIQPHTLGKDYPKQYWETLGKIAADSKRRLATNIEIQGHYLAVYHDMYEKSSANGDVLVIRQRLNSQTAQSIIELNRKYSKDKNIKAFMSWLIGGYGAYKLESFSLDDVLPELIELLKDANRMG
jgi:hypothetical protein